MSAVSDLYAGISTILTATFAAPTYSKLINPYVPELNDELSLKRGYGFYFGPKEVYKKMGRNEGFQGSIIVLQTIINRGTERDIDIRETAEKLLLEDQFMLVDYFRQNTHPIDKVWDINYQNDGGLEFVFANKQNYVMIRTTLGTLFSETC